MFLSRNSRYNRFATPAQIKNNAGLGAGSRHKLQWMAINDKRTCDFCNEMDGQRRWPNSPFYPGGVKFGDQHGGGGNPQKAHDHNCRCQEILVSV